MSSVCVDRNMQFEDTANKLDVHPDDLETIVHKYVNTEGQRNTFPTDEEIVRSLKAAPITASKTEVKCFLKMGHQGLRKFGNLAEANKYLDTLRSLYSGNHRMYRDNRGNYVVSPATPMLEGVPYSFDETLIEQILSDLDPNNPNHSVLRDMINVIGRGKIDVSMSILSKENTTMKGKKHIGDILAVCDGGRIMFDPFNYLKYLDSNYRKDDIAGRKSAIRRTLLHELTHQLSIKILNTPTENLRAEEAEFKSEIERLYNEALKNIDKEKFPYYGLEDVNEFIAEALSNRDFQRHLARIKSGKSSLWRKLIDSLSKLLKSFGVEGNTNSILADVLTATSKLMTYTVESREREAAEDALRAEVAEETQDFILPPDDLFASQKGYYTIKNELLEKANGHKKGNYRFEKRSYKGNDYMVLIIPQDRVRLEESVNMGYEMLKDLGFDPEDFDFGELKIPEYGPQYMKVIPKTIEKREQARIDREKARITSKDEITSVEEGQLEDLNSREALLKGFSKEEIDFINRIEETNPVLAQQVLDGLLTIDEASDIYRDGEIAYQVAETPRINGIPYYEGDITPSENTIFVFGSNPEGRHGAGAAKVAHDRFGAEYGVGEGLTGNSYALPTKDLRVQSPQYGSLQKGKNVQVVSNPNEHISEQRSGEAVVAYRNSSEPYNFGNPFADTSRTIEQNVQDFIDWLTTDKFKNVEPERRQWIIEQLKSGKLKGKPIYYGNTRATKAGAVSHADALDFLINEYNWNSGDKSLRSIPKETIVESIKKLYEVARSMPNKQFKVAYRNTDKATLNGYTGYEMMEMFNEAGVAPSNIVFSKEWAESGKLSQAEIRRETTQPQELIDSMYTELAPFYEGDGTDIFQLYPQLTKELDMKLADYFLGDGRLTEADFAEIREMLGFEDTTTQQGETRQESKEQTKTENDKYMERAVELTQQIDNLLNSSVMSASEVRHIAEQIVYWISDAITAYQENPESLFKNFPSARTTTKEGESEVWTEENKQKDIDKVKGMSRVEIINLIGADELIELCKQKFSPENNDFEDFDTIDKADLITDNWKAMMVLASDVFLTVEDFSIVSSKDGTKHETRTDLVADADNYNNSNSENDIAENEGDQQEHWQVETKTLDVLATMSQLVKQALLKCYLLDKEGNAIKSEFGIKERVNVREATNSILRWTQGAKNLEEMVQMLNQKWDSNPWVRQLIERLSKKDGSEIDFQSQFFGTFCKHFQPYSVVIKENGVYKSIQVNENPALSEAMTQVTTMYKIGEHPLLSTSGVNKTAFSELKTAFESLDFKKLADETKRAEMAETISYISNLVGYPVTPDMVSEILNEESYKKMYSALKYITEALERNLDNDSYNPFAFGTKDSINGNTREFLRPLTDHLEDIAVTAFYDSGKMYQSYITPSYTTKLFQKFGQTGQAFRDFLMSEYGKFEWFKAGTNPERGWRNLWLQELATMSAEDKKKMFKHKVQLNFNKHNYMKNMTDMEYILSLLTEYFSEYDGGKAKVPAWFRIPMLSNKPSSEFIKFYSYRGKGYQDTITNGLKMIFNQELMRIQTVMMRNLDSKNPRFIKNFDKNGKKFVFLDFMNDYLNGDKKNSELGKLLKAKLEGTLESDKEATLDSLATTAIRDFMEGKVKSIVDAWEAQGLMDGFKKIAGISGTEGELREKLENFVWNDTFASMNIMQLTITDMAYYKDAEDLQKRLAQIHAPGIRGNVLATDYKGRPITDGKFRTIKLTDFDGVVSNIIDNVSEVFDRKIEQAPESEKAALRALKESLVGEKGAFRDINVADAQGYSSPSSYRKKALIFGKWSKEAEEIYQKLRKGEYTHNDLKIAFQPLKPFVYSQISKESGVNGAPLSNLKVGVQYKNSEYLLIMADAILQNEHTGRPNLLRAIYEVMEESHYEEDGVTYKTDGIDTVQFESTVKAGLMGRINLNELVNNPNGEAIAKARLRTSIYETVAKEVESVNEETGEVGTNTVLERTGRYNQSSVDVVPFEDYCLQQEVPEHFKNHSQIHGSQLRFIIPSELSLVDALGNPVTYNLEGRQVSADEFKAEYEQTIADNIQEDIDNLAEELSLNSIEDIKDRNIALSRILQREILSSPRYGVDLLQACSVDENGRFRIPLGDPIQSKRVEQLINSIVKNRVNKQKIAGGPVVQVSNFGTSRELSIRFKSKDGGLLMTRAEYEKNPIKRELTQAEKYNAKYKGAKLPDTTMSYEEYVKQNQTGIAYFEVFAPIYSNQLFTQFADHNGVISAEAIEALDPELLKMIGYRIPTEDKYSMAPLKIVGFLPREAGDGIMLPNDITLLTGSDFDVDKEYLMRKEFNIKKNKGVKIHSILFDDLVNSQGDKKLSYDTKLALHELINEFLNDPFNKRAFVGSAAAKGFMSMTEGAYLKLLRTYMRNMYTVEKPRDERTNRNNQIVDMTYEVLTHETNADKMLNPGGFEPQKRMGYLVEAFRAGAGKWSDLIGMKTNELKDLCNKSKNLSFIDTHVQFYKQNSAAGSLIGIFAVDRIAHAVIESGSSDGSANYTVNVNAACHLYGDTFTVAGMEFGGYMPFDMRYDRNGQLIGKVMGSLVASAVDAVKDPVLNLMNINSNTAGILNALIRLGMPFDDAAMFLSQSVVSDVLADFSRENITGYKSLDSAIEDRLNKLKNENSIDSDSALYSEELTRDELIDGIKPDAKAEIQYKALLALKRFKKIAEALKMPTFATRFNSSSATVGPLIIDNLIMEHKMRKLSGESLIYDANTKELVDMHDIFVAHPVLNGFRQTVDMASRLLGNMPANSNEFRNLLDVVENSPLSEVIFGDRKLLSKLSDFFQSYLVMSNEVVDPSELTYYISDFPREFMEREYKKQYPDNLLVQSIKYGTEKSGRATLQVDITGLDTQQKEKLSSAWIDLHKANPELSTQLFKYNFFRAGIGFSPKTFMALVPIYVKERIKGYVDTFRVLPSVVPETVLDQFIRHNWDNNRLVPKKKVSVELTEDGVWRVTKDADIAALDGVMYFKAAVGNVDKMFMVVEGGETSVKLREVEPLGNNKEYLEMSKAEFEDAPAINKTEKSEVDTMEESEVDSIPEEVPEEQTSDKEALEDILYKILVIEGTRTREQATEYIESMRAKTESQKKAMESGVKKFFKARMESLGLTFDEKLLDDVYKLLC